MHDVRATIFIANLKENLDKRAHDVYDDDDDDEELRINGVGDGYDSFHSYRRVSHRLAHSSSASVSPASNGVGPFFKSEIARLNQENGSLRHNLDTTNAALNA
ncbi:hypothetical protein Nepgr_024288 [Nepenthes gracilis]|uniref:Uncharacterized protein n=1 Tax=Nepenthes gracilis TaxID=150966 RepID=A0AAD3T2T4_NEPGR|nr:hypothetical protein Nepgr_024288 [Nepenthes gracilis]